jgi:hypothetical protein
MSTITTIVSESLPDAHGIITVIGYRLNEKNEKIQVVQKIKRTYKTVNVYKSAVDRQNNWVKFGKATESNNSGCTTVSDIDVFMEDPNKIKPEEDVSTDKYIVKNSLEEKEPEIKVNNQYNSKPAYNKNNDGDKLGKEDEENSLKILNIHGDIQEFDLFELFKHYKIKRIFLPKDRYTCCSKGICFITFFNKSDAENALRRYNNRGFNHLILQISFVA